MGKIFGNRQAIAAVVNSFPRTIGIGFGLKRKGGEITDTKCVKVFVSKKIKNIPEGEKIPPSIHKGKKVWPTDVEEWMGFRLESGNPVIRSGDTQQGLLTCWAKGGGKIYGVSCEHVIAGDDSILTAKDKITMWARGKWQSIGFAYLGITMSGTGKLLDFGLLDAGLVNIDSEELSGQLSNMTTLPCFSMIQNEESLHSLIGLEVSGTSFNGNLLHGVVADVLVCMMENGRPFFADLLIEGKDHSGLTLKGDSGLLWRDPYGRSIAIHVGGSNQDENDRSRLCVASFVQRIAKHFQVTLLGGDDGRMLLGA